MSLLDKIYAARNASPFLSAVSEAIEKNPAYGIIIPIMIGVLIALIMILCNKAAYGKFLKALIKSGADSEETAVNAEELGVRIGGLVKTDLRKESSVLRKMVSVTEDGKYYMTPEMQTRAETVYNPKEVHPLPIILTVIGIAAAFFLLLKLVPLLLSYASDLIGHTDTH